MNKFWWAVVLGLGWLVVSAILYVCNILILNFMKIPPDTPLRFLGLFIPVFMWGSFSYGILKALWEVIRSKTQ